MSSGITDCDGIMCISLCSAAKWPHILCGDEFYLVTEFDEFSSPEMSAASGFNTDLGRREFREEGANLRSPQRLLQYGVSVGIDSVQRKYILRDIKPMVQADCMACSSHEGWDSVPPTRTGGHTITSRRDRGEVRLD